MKKAEMKCRSVLQLPLYFRTLELHAKHPCKPGINVELRNNTAALFGGDFACELNLVITLIKYYVFGSKQMKVLPSTIGLWH